MTIMHSDILSIRDMIGGVKRKMPIIAICYITLLITGFLLSHYIPQKYQSHALIKIEIPNILLDGKDKETIRTNTYFTQETIIQNEIQILKSYALLESVITTLKLNESIEYLQRNLIIKPISRSSIIRITYQDRDDKNVQKILQEIIQHYQKNQISHKKEHIIRTNEWLSERLQALSQKSEDAHAKIEQYLKINKNTDIDPQKIDSDIQELYIKLRTFKEKELHALSLLENQENIILLKLADLRSRYGSNHPKFKSIQSELSIIKNKISTIKNTHKKDGNYTHIKNKIDRLYELKNSHNIDIVQLRMLEKEAEATQKMYDDFIDRYTESSEGSLYQTPDHTIITSPTLAANNSSVTRFIVIIFFSSIVIMILIAMIAIYEYLFPRIRTPEHIYQIDNNRPVITMIPNTNDVKDTAPFLNAIQNTILNIKNNTPHDVKIGLITINNDHTGMFLHSVLSEHASIYNFDIITCSHTNIKHLNDMDLNVCILQWDTISPNDLRHIINQIKIFKISNLQFIINAVQIRAHTAYGYDDIIDFNKRYAQ